MNSDLGTFVLKQLLNSTAILGPVFLLVSFFFYIFRISRKSMFVYLAVGVLFSAIGIWCLASEFNRSSEPASLFSKESFEALEPNPAAK